MSAYQCGACHRPEAYRAMDDVPQHAHYCEVCHEKLSDESKEHTTRLSMDDEIEEYLDARARSMSLFWDAMENTPDDPTNAWLDACAREHELWSAGLKKWGLAWSVREFDLRVARESKDPR